MKKKWWIFLLAPPAIVLFTWVFGEIVVHLWNWLAPALFGWHTISFWQGLGLLVLCRILFGGWGGHGGDRGRGRRMSEKRWERMTPEEREKFRDKMRSRCGGFGAPGDETGEPA
ncbi:MAG: hypothetical protein ABR987_20115 [Terracidiphilus sp.]|jgi:hypothetical protein